MFFRRVGWVWTKLKDVITTWKNTLFCGRLLKFVKTHKSVSEIDINQTPHNQWWANIIKWTWMNIQIYLDGTLCTERMYEYIRMLHIYQTNIRTYLYSRNSINTNTNNIQGSFYLNIQIVVLITDWGNFLKQLTRASSK